MCRRRLTLKSDGTSRWASRDSCSQHPYCAKFYHGTPMDLALLGRTVADRIYGTHACLPNHTACDTKHACHCLDGQPAASQCEGSCCGDAGCASRQSVVAEQWTLLQHCALQCRCSMLKQTRQRRQGCGSSCTAASMSPAVLKRTAVPFCATASELPERTHCFSSMLCVICTGTSLLEHSRPNLGQRWVNLQPESS